MLPLLLILRFGVTFYPSGPIRSIDVYYNRVYLLYEDGLVILDRTGDRRVSSISIPGGRLTIFDPEYGDLYILTEDKILRYHEGSEHLFEVSLGGKRVDRIGVGKNYLYLDTKSGYYCLRKGSCVIKPTTTVKADRWQSELEPAELHRYPILTPYYRTDNLLNHYPITALTRSRNRLYVGSDLGIEIYNLLSGEKKNITTGPIEPVLKISDLDTLIGFISRRKISFFSPSGDTWFYRSFLHDLIDVTSNRNYLYLATKGGLFSIGSGITLPIFKSPILTIKKTGDIIYLFAESQLFALPPYANRPFKIITYPGEVRDLAVYENKIYIGSDQGLFVLDSLMGGEELIDPRGYIKFGVDDLLAQDRLYIVADGHLIAYKDSFQYLNVNDATSLASGSNRIWIGTESGLWFYQDGNINKCYDLPRVRVYSILEKDHHLWAATTRGLYRVRID